MSEIECPGCGHIFEPTSNMGSGMKPVEIAFCPECDYCIEDWSEKLEKEEECRKRQETIEKLTKCR